MDVQQIRNSLRLAEEERKNLTKILDEQRTAFKAMMHAPQNMSYIALKRNLEVE